MVGRTSSWVTAHAGELAAVCVTSLLACLPATLTARLPPAPPTPPASELDATFSRTALGTVSLAEAQASVSADFARAVALFNEHDDTGDALDEAERVFGTVLERQPRHAAARAYLGLIALERGNVAAAEEAFTASLAVDRSCAEAHVGRVRLLRARGQWQASYDEARLAVRLSPNSALARWELVTVLCHRAEAPVGDAQRVEAIPHLQRLIALDRNLRDAHMELAELYRELGRCREAIPHYQAVLRIGQTRDDSDVWVYEVNRTVAECYEKLGDRRRAVDYLERYLRELRAVGAGPEAVAEVEQKLALLRR